MSTPDDNLIAFTGDAAGNIWRNGEHIIGPAVPEHADRPRIWTEAGITLPEGRNIADTLKFSGVSDFELSTLGEVPGGYEDVIDCNNECRNITIHAPGGLRANGKLVGTIKGGCQGIRIVGPILSGGNVADFGLGNWSDQSAKLTRDVVLDTPHQSPGSATPATTYYQMNAEAPTTTTGVRLKCTFRVPAPLRRLWVWAHGLLKKLGVKV